jgi:CubicO group peptidase (beta-lactamase class C family)
MSSARLQVLRALLRTEPTSAMMIVVHGKVVFEYGDVAKPMKIASIRKSILAMLFGNPVQAGKIDMRSTVVDLGLEEKEPFLPNETHAMLVDLLTARSGIYRDEASDSITERQPRLGSEYPGTVFFYNNWEFDAAGTAFEKLTGRNIYDALQADLAEPLGMQDFHRDLQRKFPSPGSVHPEYAMFLSTRDLARIGLLMLHMGDWNRRQVISANWVSYMTSITTPWDEMNPFLFRLRGEPERWGFGLGWWVWDAPPYPPGDFNWAPYQGAYMARGSGGQYLMVLPAKDMVIVHMVDLDTHPDSRNWMGDQDWDAISNLVIGSFCSGKCG